MKRSSVFLVLLLLLTPAAYAGKKPTAPGTYHKWGPNIDVLEVVQTFKAADYSRIVVEPIDTTDAPLPDKDDNSYEPAKKVLANAREPFVIGLQSRITKDVTAADAAPHEAGTLVVRARVLKADPGSRSARYWGGFGAGASQTQVQGEILDAATGAVLLRFTQERWGSGGWFGGGYEALMNSNLRQIGRDVAAVIKAF